MPTPSIHVLIAGGGVAGLEAALALHALSPDRVAIELLSPARDFVERPLSVVTPFTDVGAPHLPLTALERIGVRLRRGSLAEVSTALREVVTTDGERVPYDRLIVATGARRAIGVPGAITFFGPVNAGQVERALRAVSSRVLLVAPPGCGWTLPIYELALIAARELPAGARVSVVSAEPRPLDLFGRMASDAMARLLHRAQVEFIPSATPVEAADTLLVLEQDRMLAADAVISLPILRGLAVEGLPSDADGFIPVDDHSRVHDVPSVYAAGDATAEPVKQGGLACQQADAAAELIVAETGALITPHARRRILRAAVLTGDEPLYLRRDLDDETTWAHVVPQAVSRTELWAPNSKIAGRHLAGFLASGGTSIGATLVDHPAVRSVPAPS